MIINTYPMGEYGANCYFVIDELSKDTLVIDPGANGKSIIREIDRLGCNVKAILLTHAHFDHIGAVEELKEKYKVPLYVNEGEVDNCKKDNTVYAKLPSDYNAISDGDILDFNNINVKCLHTPGHSKGGMCFLVEDNVFTGDTLFQGSVGRSDFIGGDMGELINGIKTKLLPLGDDIKVFPGHGPSSTIGFEKIRNPYL